MHQDATGYVCLLIQPAKKEDAGWYTLSAKNEAGIVSCTARLDIYGRFKCILIYENNKDYSKGILANVQYFFGLVKIYKRDMHVI